MLAVWVAWIHTAWTTNYFDRRAIALESLSDDPRVVNGHIPMFQASSVA